jgi:Trk K+ transport system NAD-binding subunit
VSVLFILLAADLSIASVFALGWGSVWTVLILMFVVRPISVFCCTINSSLNWRQKLFISWIGPKGIVSASVASLFAIVLTQSGINGGDAIKALVFLTIMMTVFIQGLTARWVAKLLKITSSSATGAVIIGCNPLSRIIARLLQSEGESVVLIDTDPKACEMARKDDLEVFQSSGLDPEVLEEAGISSMGTFVALTNNGEVNLVLAQYAIDEFQPPRVLAIFPHQSNNNNSKISPALTNQVAIKQWNTYIEDQQFKLGKTVLKEEDLSFQQAHLDALIRTGELLPLLIKREDNLQIVKASEQWKTHDEIIYLLHDPRPQLLKRLSGASQASRLVVEKLPKVEEVPLFNG